jgi:CMP-2-keto-3-deoxyoctulosonic acid synthetase
VFVTARQVRVRAVSGMIYEHASNDGGQRVYEEVICVKFHGKEVPMVNVQGDSFAAVQCLLVSRKNGVE